MMTSPIEILTPLAPPQPHGLSILLKLRDQRIALLHHIGILLVLVVRPIRLNNPVDSINGAGDAVAGNELGQIPVSVSMITLAGAKGLTDPRNRQ